MSEPQFTQQDWRRLLASLGEDPDRAGLVETPSRVAKAWKHWTAGYTQDPAECLKAFEDGAQEYNELIVVRGIPVYSHCEHHLAPFFGTATIGYVPERKNSGSVKADAPGRLLFQAATGAGTAHDSDCQRLDDASATESGRRGHSLPAHVHGKPRH